MPNYNAGIHSIDGNRLVIVINDMYADYGLARPGRSRLCAFLQSKMRGVTIQLNADRPFADMSHIPDSGYNSEWQVMGNRIFITIPDLDHLEKLARGGRSWLVAYRQIVIGDLHIKFHARISVQTARNRQLRPKRRAYPFWK